MPKSQQMPLAEAITVWLNELQKMWQSQTLVKLTLSKNIQRNDPFKALLGRPLQIKKGEVVGFTHRFATRDEAHNLSFEDASALLQSHIGGVFLQADLYGVEGSIHLYTNRNGTAAIARLAAVHNKADSGTHNREKPRLLQTSAPYLHYLGITSADGKALLSGERKYRQIFHYIEIVGALMRENPLPSGAHILDAGSGKGYLTFALYDYLTNQLHSDYRMTGIELRPELVAHCNGVAERCGFENLKFEVGHLDDFARGGRVDALIALHACDIATDLAIARAVQDDAHLIMVAPCCQKQVRNDMQGSELMDPMLKHGILKERAAEWLTDGLRALILEAVGYRTRTMEFIGVEHTPKNLLITAVKSTPKPELLHQIAQLKQLYGLPQHYLEKLLSKELAALS